MKQITKTLNIDIEELKMLIELVLIFIIKTCIIKFYFINLYFNLIKNSMRIREKSKNKTKTQQINIC